MSSYVGGAIGGSGTSYFSNPPVLSPEPPPPNALKSNVQMRCLYCSKPVPDDERAGKAPRTFLHVILPNGTASFLEFWFCPDPKCQDRLRQESKDGTQRFMRMGNSVDARSYEFTR